MEPFGYLGDEMSDLEQYVLERLEFVQMKAQGMMDWQPEPDLELIAKEIVEKCQ